MNKELPYVGPNRAPFRVDGNLNPYVGGATEVPPSQGIPLIVIGGFQKTYASFDGLTFQRIGNCGTGSVLFIKYLRSIGRYYAVNSDQGIYELQPNLTWSLVYTSAVGVLQSFTMVNLSASGAPNSDVLVFGTPFNVVAVSRIGGTYAANYVTGFSPDNSASFGGNAIRMIGGSRSNKVSVRTSSAATVVSTLPSVPAKWLNHAYLSLNGRNMVSDDDKLWWSATAQPTLPAQWTEVTLPNSNASDSLWNFCELPNVLIIPNRQSFGFVAVSTDNGSTFNLRDTGIFNNWLAGVPAIGYIYLCGSDGKVCRTANGTIYEDLGTFDSGLGSYSAIGSLENR